MQAQAQSGVHQGQYQKNLTFKGPVTGDEIIYTLYLPPGTPKTRVLIRSLFFSMGQEGAMPPLKSCKVTRPPARRERFKTSPSSFRKNTGARCGGTGPRINDRKPMSSRNSFLISRRNTPLPGIVTNEPSWGFPWERPARSIGVPST